MPRDEDNAADDVGGSSRWPDAVLAGLQVAICWHRQRPGKTLLATIAIGLAATLVTYLGGPLAVAAMGLAGAMLSLSGLIEPLDAGVAGIRYRVSSTN